MLVLAKIKPVEAVPHGALLSDFKIFLNDIFNFLTYGAAFAYSKFLDLII